MKRTIPLTLLSATLFPALLAACGSDDTSRAVDAAAPAQAAVAAAAKPNVVTVTARDFNFDAPATIPAGLTTFRLVNQGPDLHHVILVPLRPGQTAEQLVHAIHEQKNIPTGAVLFGGPNAPAPGEDANATVTLESGEYALICEIPTNGVPHTAMGMYRQITVTPSDKTPATEPAADVTVKLVDYDFELSAPITAGRRTIRFENPAEQPHEAFIAQLAPGKTPQDLLAWIEKPQGPPPGKPMGGITLISKGKANTITADFEPGEYALICFVPDAGDGLPHFAHGMIKKITVS